MVEHRWIMTGPLVMDKAMMELIKKGAVVETLPTPGLNSFIASVLLSHLHLL